MTIDDGPWLDMSVFPASDPESVLSDDELGWLHDALTTHEWLITDDAWEQMLGVAIGDAVPDALPDPAADDLTTDGEDIGELGEVEGGSDDLLWTDHDDSLTEIETGHQDDTW
jgi:hypothetical protein